MYSTYVAYTTSYVYVLQYLQGAKSNGRGAKEKPSRFSNRMKFKSLFSNTPMRSIFETPHRRSGRGFLAVHRSGREIKNACYLRERRKRRGATKRGRGISAAVKNREVVISNSEE